MSAGAGGHYLVLGAGGLGCPALLGLVAAGETLRRDALRLVVKGRTTIEEAGKAFARGGKFPLQMKAARKACSKL